MAAPQALSPMDTGRSGRQGGAWSRGAPFRPLLKPPPQPSPASREREFELGVSSRFRAMLAAPSPAKQREAGEDEGGGGASFRQPRHLSCRALRRANGGGNAAVIGLQTAFRRGGLMAHEVFLSYSSKDRAAADAVCRALETAGLKVWIAPRDVLPGSAGLDRLSGRSTALPRTARRGRAEIAVFGCVAGAPRSTIRRPFSRRCAARATRGTATGASRRSATSMRVSEWPER